IKERGLLDRLLTFDYGFVRPDDAQILKFRRGRGGGPSTHALGIGFDINRSYNSPGQPGAALGQRGSVLELVPIFREFDFSWAGENDATHFQYAYPKTAVTDNTPKE